MKLTNSIYKLRKRSGQTLLEVVLAIAVAVLVVAALAILGNLSLKMTKDSLRRAEATKLASAGLEASRYVRDACGFDNINPGSGSSKCYELVDSGGSVCGVLEMVSACDGGENDWILYTLDSGGRGLEKYSRKLEVVGTAPGEVLVKSQVKWAQSGSSSGTRSIVLTTVLTKWD